MVELIYHPAFNTPAADREIKKVYAIVLKVNTAMLHMFRERGLTIRDFDETLISAQEDHWMTGFCHKAILIINNYAKSIFFNIKT